MPCLQTRVDNLERSVGINGEGVTKVLGLVGEFLNEVH
ncbi:hypothetical protein JL09_g5513 [Pichia kudriavzevii]|uniref:Uncharacterized protein n=1 Tax=Pichia kudriavzevii TaxID=4909 RepID=A0A099NTX0_PICKU|nr:hypothetical protein JL09_g5513 [Pichia kudriavzevii]